MKTLVIASLAALVGCSPVLAESVSRETSNIEHPYTYAIDYCSNRGGLAQYTIQGDAVKFSCADDLTAIITITTD